MKKTLTYLLPAQERVLAALGENIKLARLRRNFSMEMVAERAGISRATLWQVEKGNPGVAIGNYLQVLVTLGLQKDILNVANDDILGRKLQDAAILVRERAPKKR